MAFALLKLSYKNAGDPSLVGGICGTGFFVTAQAAVTAHHALNAQTFEPNDGYSHARVWLVSRNRAVHRIEQDDVEMHPEIDATAIHFKNPASDFAVYQPAVGDIEIDRSVTGIGHVGNAMPPVDANWKGSELVIRTAELNDFIRPRCTIRAEGKGLKMDLSLYRANCHV